MTATNLPIELITGLGTAASKNTGVASGDVPLMDGTGYPAADGSQITGIASDGAMNLEANKALSGLNSVEWTGLPAGITQMMMAGRNMQIVSSTSLMGIQLGNGGGYVTSGYGGVFTDPGKADGSNSSDFRVTEDLVAAADVATVWAWFTKVNGHVWVMTSLSVNTTGASEDINTCEGEIDLTTELDRIKIFTTGGSNNWVAGGHVSLYTNRS